MSDTVIHVENVSKRYVIGHQRGRGDGLRHALEAAVRRPFGWLRPQAMAQAPEEFWALKDVSFEIKQGEVVGIIGRNGAGKSTLLKILSRITEPTAGRIRIRGRVASLLEVGTGFHQELTGRENIYLNGAILGMSKAEIRQKFDEIVAFSEIERFLDTPVKRYSSGMYVRLAFAVAAHLEPEILIVDEVLAVGDAQFQKKCLGKMQDVSKGGRTILFVSHNMAAISRLCQKCALMDGGQLKLYGPTNEIIPHYLKSGKETDGLRTWDANVENTSEPRLKICAVRIKGPDGMVTGHVDIRQSVTVEVEYQILETLPKFRFGLKFFTADGTLAFSTSDSFSTSYDAKSSAAGHYITRCLVPGGLLNEGVYSLTLSADIALKQVFFIEEGAISFSVEQTGGLSMRYAEKWPGAVCPQLEWETQTA